MARGACPPARRATTAETPVAVAVGAVDLVVDKWIICYLKKKYDIIVI